MHMQCVFIAAYGDAEAGPRHAPSTRTFFSARRLLVATLSSIEDQMPLLASSEFFRRGFGLRFVWGSDGRPAEAVVAIGVTLGQVEFGK